MRLVSRAPPPGHHLTGSCRCWSIRPTHPAADPVGSGGAAKQVGDGAPAVVIKGLREGGQPVVITVRTGRPAGRRGAEDGTPDTSGRPGNRIAALRLADAQGIPTPRILGIDTGGRSAGARRCWRRPCPGAARSRSTRRRHASGGWALRQPWCTPPLLRCHQSCRCAPGRSRPATSRATAGRPLTTPPHCWRPPTR
jgi:hypothetical protein